MVHDEPDRVPYIAPFEVVIHNTPDDCWVSFLGKVYDVTPVLKKFEGQTCVRPLLAFAGKDISDWFDERTGDIQHYVHPITGALVPYCPHGPIPDVDINYPNTTWKKLDGLPWWKDESLCIYKGPLTKKVRPIRIFNTLTMKEVTLNVCSEDTIRDIQKRYSIFCHNVNSYTWRTTGYCNEKSLLSMDETLDGNGIFDEREKFFELRMPMKSEYIPVLTLHYNDDMLMEEEEDFNASYGDNELKGSVYGCLHMDWTLDENGIVDDRQKTMELHILSPMPPCLLLYYTDDFQHEIDMYDRGEYENTPRSNSEDTPFDVMNVCFSLERFIESVSERSDR